MRNQSLIQTVQNYLRTQYYLDTCRRDGVDDFAAQEAADRAREDVEATLEHVTTQPATEPAARDIRRILVAVQDAEHDATVVDRAACIARQLNAEIVLLHVLEPVVAYATEWDYSAPPDTQRMRTEAREMLEMLAGRATDLKVARELREGEPTVQILSVAQDRGVDMIVMGTHGPGRIEQLFMGSTASAVIRRASCPVMVMNRHAAAHVVPREEMLSANEAVAF